MIVMYQRCWSCVVKIYICWFHLFIFLSSNSTNWSVSWKMIAYSIPKRSDLYTLCSSKLLENHTLHSGTYLYGPYMPVPPPFPPGVIPLSQSFLPHLQLTPLLLRCDGQIASVMALALFLFENSCTKEIILLYSQDLNSIQFQFKINMYRLQRLKKLTSSAKQQLLLTVDWGIKSVAESSMRGNVFLTIF